MLQNLRFWRQCKVKHPLLIEKNFTLPPVDEESKLYER